MRVVLHRKETHNWNDKRGSQDRWRDPRPALKAIRDAPKPRLVGASETALRRGCPSLEDSEPSPADGAAVVFGDGLELWRVGTRFWLVGLTDAKAEFIMSTELWRTLTEPCWLESARGLEKVSVWMQIWFPCHVVEELERTIEKLEHHEKPERHFTKWADIEFLYKIQMEIDEK